jgi:tripartite-type tricarboxylate transporter receptor subunit TctC
VPYKSIAQMMTDILGNQVPLGAPAAASALPQLRSGKLKVLAVTTAKRSAQLPDVPTVAESAGIADFDVSAWNGLVAPARTPDEVVAKVYADVAKIAQTKEFVEALQKAGLESDPMGPAEFGAFISSELAKWSKLVKESGAKLD